MAPEEQLVAPWPELAAAILATILLRGVGNGDGHEPQSKPDAGDDDGSVRRAVVAEL